MRRATIAAGIVGVAALQGCGLSEKLDDPTSLPRMLIAGTNVQPGERVVAGVAVQRGSAADVPLAPEDAYCPRIDVAEGGSVIQVGGGAASRSQITLGQLARECLGQPDGSTLVKVGVQGRALLGAGGGAGRFSVPVRVVVRQGERIIASRVRQAAVQIPPGDTHGTFVVVEDGILVPRAAAQDFEIEVGLGGAGQGARARRG
jgi:hypothetical protein